MFDSQKDLHKYISDVLEERINYVINRKIEEGLLNQIRNDVMKEFENKFNKLNTLTRIVEDLKLLFKF